MTIPFWKAHGAGNDFLYTWERDLANVAGDRLPAIARAICARHTGVGADGWYLICDGDAGCVARIHLFNSDGSSAELSGNGTRCAAAVITHTAGPRDSVTIRTGAGPRWLRLLAAEGNRYSFEMAMGRPVLKPGDLRFPLPLGDGSRDVTILDVGNPQCAVFVDNFEFDWKALGAAIEAHAHFARRSNVCFVRKIDDHTIEARFFERGAGATLSSGTGATGAAAASVLRGLVRPPVTIVTEAGPLEARWEGEEVMLSGPAVVVARGEFWL
jgi:diaminopimelate epimerase